MRASQQWRFFCVVPPDHLQLALEEFQAKSSVLSEGPLEAKPLPGGFEIETSWEIGRGLVHVLKLPTRVLIRLKTFPARDFPKFFNTIRGLPWNQWLQHPTPELRVSAQRCRLMHTTRIEETFFNALSAAHVRSPFSTRYQTEGLAPDLLIIRGEDDQWTVSLDLAGDALYKRGDFTVKGAAPLRETHAAAVLWYLFKDHQGAPIQLVDPMCGAGTLLREALSFFNPTMQQFAYLTSPVNRGVHPWKPRCEQGPWPIERALGLDINQELLGQLKGNDKLSFAHHDLFERAIVPQGTCWIVCNPPYGERLAVGELNLFTEKLGAALSLYSPQRAALIVPRSFPVIRLKGLEQRARHPFSNGGIPVEARVFH